LIRIIHADVIDGLAQIPDQTVQCVVTSPPYWGLRDYGVEGQIGLEKTPEEFITKMVEVFREVRRVLRDDGTCWLNLGDSYAADRGGSCQPAETLAGGIHGHSEYDDALRGRLREGKQSHRDAPAIGLKHKDMVGIPWRVAFALQSDGWYLRSDIIWSKPNPMPESVTDRPTKSHEYIFLLTKKARYYYDADAVREPGTRYEWNTQKFKDGDITCHRHSTQGKEVGDSTAGRNRRTVWEIATQPFPGSHFATFPEALVEPCIKAGTSERGCCSVCGAPWVRVVDHDFVGDNTGKRPDSLVRPGTLCRPPSGALYKGKTTGWQPSCSCNADTVPCVVLDPFGGSGTVGKVARDLKRKAILIELNAEYIKIARERLRLNEQLGAFA
jgi:DNA modification methylase